MPTKFVCIGEFGRVFNGVWMHKHDDGSFKSQDVAIKTVKGYYMWSILCDCWRPLLFRLWINGKVKVNSPWECAHENSSPWQHIENFGCLSGDWCARWSSLYCTALYGQWRSEDIIIWKTRDSQQLSLSHKSLANMWEIVLLDIVKLELLYNEF